MPKPNIVLIMTDQQRADVCARERFPLDTTPCLDHLARRRSEIDVINGKVVELSREIGFEAPYNETLCALVRARESRFPET